MSIPSVVGPSGSHHTGDHHTDRVDEDNPQKRLHSAIFYRCVNGANCGMRFPVAMGENFRGHCPRCGAPVQVVATSEAEELSQTGAPPVSRAATQEDTGEVRLLLDNWRSLFNVGSAFRTADGAGVQHLYLCGITATPDEQQKLAKTALGAEQTVAWSYHADAVGLAETLQSQGAQVWVLERGPSAHSLFDIKSMTRDIPVVLAAGNEVVGVDPGLIEVADQVIQLPMLGSKESLNVAIALSIATYWLRAQPVTTTPTTATDEPLTMPE